MRITNSSPCGRQRARSTFLISSSRLGRRIRDRGRRSRRSAPGCGARARCRRLARRPATRTPRRETYEGRHGMPRTLLARPRLSRTSPRTNLVPPPTRSRPRAPPHRKERARAQGDSSAGGSATSSRRRFASSSSTTSGCGTPSAGRSSTAESASCSHARRSRRLFGNGIWCMISGLVGPSRTVEGHGMP
jgi:hypothetical protein